MLLPIIKLPTPTLRQRSIEVDRQTLLLPETQKFITDMIPTMYDDDGIGLAAPQVARNIRICIIGKEADKKLKTDLVLVNPIYDRTSRKMNTDSEGCLSVPNTFGKVKRYSDIQVTALDRLGNEIRFEAHKFFARVIQHEVDHLDGILFIDKATDVYTISAAERLEYLATRDRKPTNTI